MKLVKEYLNEKFDPKSDPIHDMEIGAVSFFDSYMEIYKSAANMLYKKWTKFLKSFIGKTIKGKMSVYELGNYMPTIEERKILIKNIESMDETGRVKIEVENDDNTYVLIESEKYIISDE